MGFTKDHVYFLGVWCQKLGLREYQKALFDLFHKMTTQKFKNREVINSTCMGALQVIRDYERNKGYYYQVLRDWGMQ